MRTIKDQLKEWKRKNKTPKRKPRKRKKKKELSFSDYEELMGMHRPTYKRHRGAFRQK